MNPIPKPLHQKLVLTLLVGIGCFFTGLALSVSIRDKTLFFLSAAILVFSCIRTVSLYFKIKSGSYYTLEGTCCSVSFLPFRKNYTAALTDRDGRDPHPSSSKGLQGTPRTILPVLFSVPAGLPLRAECVSGKIISFR